MSSDSESESDIDLVEVPDVPLFDLVSQRLLLVSVPESEENPDEFMRNKAIKEFGVEPSSLHIVDIKGTYICFDGSKIADAIARGGVEGENQGADRKARKKVPDALKFIFNELKETQKTCQERFQSILSSDDSNVDEDHVETPATPSEDDAVIAALRTLFHSLADEYMEMIKSMEGTTTVHDKCKEELGQCKEKLDKLDEGVKQAGTKLENLEQDGPTAAKEKHLATLKVLQVLVQNMNTASEVLTLIDRAQESQRQPSDKQKSLIERTQAFEKSLSELKQSKSEDDEVRNLRDENARYKAALEEAKKREKEVSESLSKLLEKQSGGNSDAMNSITELGVRITQLKEKRDSTAKSLEQERQKITQLEKERDGAVESLRQERQKITQLEQERDSTVKSLEQEHKKVKKLDKSKKKLEQSLKQSNPQNHELDNVTETLWRIVGLKEGVSPKPRLEALQQQAFKVASEFKTDKVRLELLLKKEAPSKLEMEEVKKRADELNKEIERFSSENANLQQKIQALMIRLHEWNGTVSTGPFAYPHTMLFLPRPDCDGVYEAYNQGYPCYFLSDESTDFREQIRDKDPVIGTLLLDPEPHIAEPGNRFKLAPGTRYWLCTCAAINR